MHQSNAARYEYLLEWQSRPVGARAGVGTCISHCYPLLTMRIYSGLLGVCPIPEQNQDITAFSLAATAEVRQKMGWKAKVGFSHFSLSCLDWSDVISGFQDFVTESEA